MPENRDSDFSWDDFEKRINTELVGALGNFIHRTLTFTAKNFGEIPKLDESKLGAEDKEALEQIKTTFDEVATEIETCQFKNAIKSVMKLAHFGNRYFDKKAPWDLIKTDKDACGNALHLNLRLVKALAVLMYPFMPHASDKLWKTLGNLNSIQEVSWTEGLEPLTVGTSLEKPTPLFNKIEVKETKEPEKVEEVEEGKEVEKPEGLVDMISIGEFQKINIRIGQVIKIEPHPDADKLYVMQVDFGSEQRQLVAGLRPYYKEEELLNQKIVVIMNLEPAKLRGVESNGMLLAADDGKGNVTLLVPDPNRDTALGSRVK
jgi:methionyl-tRNA synthetase